MSSLDCISDDLEEEIVQGMKTGCINLIPVDFDFESLGNELNINPGRSVCWRKYNELLLKLMMLYPVYVTMLSDALDIKPDEAETRMRERKVPDILKKMEEK